MSENADQPGLAAAYAYWDTSLPLVPIEEAWWGREGAAPAVGEPVMNGDAKQVRESPAKIAREMRLRGEAARQVEESRAARGVL